MAYNSLEGMLVTIYMDGGWEITGRISSSGDDRFIVKANKSMYMIFKSKVSALLVKEEGEPAQQPDRVPVSAARGVPQEYAEDNFPMNSASYDDSGMTLPENLLEKPITDGEDFSIFFSANQSGVVKNTGITFGVEEDGSNEET